MGITVLLCVYGVLISILGLIGTYYIFICFIKLLKILTKVSFCLLFNYSYKTVNTFSKKQCTIYDFFEMVNKEKYCDSKKELLRYIDTQYPNYKIPHYNDLNFYEKELPEFYEKMKSENMNYPKIVASIYTNLLDFETKIKQFIENKTREFYYKNIVNSDSQIKSNK